MKKIIFIYIFIFSLPVYATVNVPSANVTWTEQICSAYNNCAAITPRTNHVGTAVVYTAAEIDALLENYTPGETNVEEVVIKLNDLMYVNIMCTAVVLFAIGFISGRQR